jgi:hypothetical protein
MPSMARRARVSVVGGGIAGTRAKACAILANVHRSDPA